MNYETKDASLAIIGTGAGILVFLVVASIATSAWFYKAHSAAVQGFPTAGRQTSFTSGPGEETESSRSWQAVEAEAAGLGGYGWTDRKNGIARIPIDRAMQLVAGGARPAPFPAASAAVKEAEEIQNETPMPR